MNKAITHGATDTSKPNPITKQDNAQLQTLSKSKKMNGNESHTTTNM